MRTSYTGTVKKKNKTKQNKGKNNKLSLNNFASIVDNQEHTDFLRLANFPVRCSFQQNGSCNSYFPTISVTTLGGPLPGDLNCLFLFDLISLPQPCSP